MKMGIYIHETAEVSDRAEIGEGTKIWHQAQVREGSRIGSCCIIGKGAYVDSDVSIGCNVKIQNGCFIWGDNRGRRLPRPRCDLAQ
jgi:UDP-2-acetamido-3-amino-2,3-dideoxy-glucuronate N-acetyltransferase